MAESQDERLSKLLCENLCLEIINEGTKVKCKLSGHEMPCRAEVVESYVKGKKYKRLKAKEELNIESYMKHLEHSSKKGIGSQLYCKLTCRYISDEPQHIYRHIQGRRFQKALKRWEECQETGEEFKPRQPSFPKNKIELSDNQSETEEVGQSAGSSEELWEGPTEDKDVEDDLADLYPSSDFEPESEGSDVKMDVEDEGTAQESCHTENNTDNIGSKRKKKEDHELKKKMKVADSSSQEKNSKKPKQKNPSV